MIAEFLLLTGMFVFLSLWFARGFGHMGIVFARSADRRNAVAGVNHGRRNLILLGVLARVFASRLRACMFEFVAFQLQLFLREVVLEKEFEKRCHRTGIRLKFQGGLEFGMQEQFLIDHLLRLVQRQVLSTVEQGAGHHRTTMKRQF